YMPAATTYRPRFPAGLPSPHRSSPGREGILRRLDRYHAQNASDGGRIQSSDSSEWLSAASLRRSSFRSGLGRLTARFSCWHDSMSHLEWLMVSARPTSGTGGISCACPGGSSQEAPEAALC